MTQLSSDHADSPLCLAPFQTQLVEFLKQHDPQSWTWFAAFRQRAGQLEDLKFDLLKATYRVDRDSAAEVYETADVVASRLGIAAPITIYQAQDPIGLNASLAYVPGEIHVVLHGPVAEQLSSLELAGLLGHELSHFLLWESWDGDLLIAADLLRANAHDRHGHPTYAESLRLLSLYNEILCDRGALFVTEDLRAVVSMLVKVQTGVRQINPDSYLRQADEIFARGPAVTEGVTHPESFIRARAIRLWDEQGSQATEEITRMLESDFEITRLDLLRQVTVAQWTRSIIDRLLSHPWFRTDLVLAHARLYFDNYVPPAGDDPAGQDLKDCRAASSTMRDYFCFLLLDFVSADRELDEPALAAALIIADELDVKNRLMELARQELRLRKNELDRVDARKEAIVQEADRSAAGI